MKKMQKAPVLDWKEISKTYKLSFKLLSEAYMFMLGEEKGTYSMKNTIILLGRYDPRNLYDFFDAHNIYISVYAENKEFEAIIENETEVLDYTADFSNRSKCEESAFLLAFNHLENQLQ